MYLHAVQRIGGDPEAIFRFFSDARNLEQITPPWLRFRILEEGEIGMGVGAMINYALWLGPVPLRWRSRITAWEPGRRFVDEQVRGPYRTWVHEHRFTPAPEGLVVEDLVHYEAPGPAWAERWLVRPQLTRIFGYRQRELARIFEARGPASIEFSAGTPDRSAGVPRPGGVA